MQGEPGVANLPIAQSTQVMPPAAKVERPAGHGAHNAAPATGATLPMPHSAHVAMEPAPCTALAVPGAQSIHTVLLVAPATGDHEPAGHSAHDDAFTSL